MVMADHMLLVEGEADKNFFEQVCKTLELHTRVTVAPPRDVGGSIDRGQPFKGKTGVKMWWLTDEGKISATIFDRCWYFIS